MATLAVAAALRAASRAPRTCGGCLLPPNATQCGMADTEIVVGTTRALADNCARRLREMSARAARLALALPGGSVAEAFFPVLAGAVVNWGAIDIFWSDERAVPPADDDSNFKLASRLLLTAPAVAAARVHRMPAEHEDLDGAAAAYEAELDGATTGHTRVDVALVGVGPDGHICSLFPGHPALDEQQRRVVAVTDSPKPPRRRLTLTLPALRDATVVAAAFGSAKADVIAEAVRDPESRLPLALALRGARKPVLLLDAEAAGALAR
jgi:6-phosphogluconolactonase